MEPKQQTHPKTTASASTSTPRRRVFPPELLTNILSRLPVKSLLRFSSASPQWRTLLTLPNFISAHLHRSPPSLLIHVLRAPAGVSGHVFYSYRLPDKQHYTAQRIPGSPSPTAAGPFEVVGVSPNGVVCIAQRRAAQSFTLWNPATRSVLPIPDPSTPDPDSIVGASAGFGFDSRSNKYALIRIVRLREQPGPFHEVARIFDFRAGCWAELENTFGRITFRFASVVCEAVVNGVPYWRGMGHSTRIGTNPRLVWFNVRRSEFRLEGLPFSLDAKEMRMGEIRPGRVGAIVWDQEGPFPEDSVDLDLWTRGDYGVWSFECRILDFPTGGLLAGFHADAEMVYETVGVDDGKLHLCLVKIGGNFLVDIKGIPCLEGDSPGSCTTMTYKESLSPLPRIGSGLN